MRIAVCDDILVQVCGNVDMIQKWAKDRDMAVTIDTFSSAEEFLFRWSDGHQYDLALLDINMRMMSGMDLAKAIRKTDSDLQIVFITGLVEHVFEGYEVSALSYLTKPYTPEQLFKTLDRAYTICNQKETGSLLVSQDGQLTRIPYREIVYMEIRGHYFDIYTHTMGTHRMKKKMDEMIGLLDVSMFIRCHRSYIINISHVTSLNRQEVKLKSGQLIPLSQTYVQQVVKMFTEHHLSRVVTNT